MNFILLAPWVLVVVALCWGVWLTFRKESASSARMKAVGFSACIILVLITVSLVADILPPSTVPLASTPIAQGSDILLTTSTPTFMPTSTPIPDQPGLLLVGKYRSSQSCMFDDWIAMSRVVYSENWWGWEAMHVAQPGETLDSIIHNYDKGIYLNMLTLCTYSCDDDVILAGYYEAGLREWTRQITTTNGLMDPSEIRPGRVLIIPDVSEGCGGGPIVVVTPAPTVLPGPIVHIVERGETLYSISKHYNSSVQAIMTASGLRSDLIREGDKLVIPSR